VWDWFHCAEEVAGYLGKIAEAVEKGWLVVPSPEYMARHARTLATKVREFEEAYNDYGDGLILGYFVIIHDGMRVEALVARGEAEPAVEAVDVEHWLAEFERSVGEG
jgi:hypothetical protein